MKLLEEGFAVQLDSQVDSYDDVKLRSLAIKRWLRTSEVALYLGTSVGCVRVMVHRRQLSPKKYCGRNYFDREDIDLLIEASNFKKGKYKWR